MAGARIPVTFPIRLIPPRMTSATMLAVMSPETQGAIPKVSRIVSATVLACTPFPERKAVIPRRRAKKTAMGFQACPSPFSM